MNVRPGAHRALRQVAWGFLVVLLDVRVNQLDLLHDLIGWGLCLVGLAKLPPGGWFLLARIGAGVGVVAALPDLLNPPNGWIVTSLDTVGQTGLVVGVCLGLAPLLGAERTRAARWIAGLWLGHDVLGLATSALAPDEDLDDLMIAVPWVVLLVALGVALAVWFTVFLFQCSREALGPAVGAAEPAGGPG